MGSKIYAFKNVDETFVYHSLHLHVEYLLIVSGGARDLGVPILSNNIHHAVSTDVIGVIVG